MLFFLAMAFTLLAVVVDCAVGACGSWQTQVNISMCNWQGLRGEYLLLLRPLWPELLSADTSSQRSSRYDLSRWRTVMASAVLVTPLWMLIGTDNCRGYSDGCVNFNNDGKEWIEYKN